MLDFRTGVLVGTLLLASLGGLGCKKKEMTAAPHELNPRQRALPGAKLQGVSFKGADLSAKDLTGANLTEADLSEANLSNTNLTRAILTKAILTGVRSGGIQGLPKSLPTEWKLISGYLVGPGANLRGAVLTYANFDHMNLDDVDFTGANLLYATFRGTTLNRATVAGALMYSSELGGVISKDLQGSPETLPKDWRIERGQFIGR